MPQWTLKHNISIVYASMPTALVCAPLHRLFDRDLSDDTMDLHTIKSISMAYIGTVHVYDIEEAVVIQVPGPRSRRHVVALIRVTYLQNFIGFKID